MVRTLALLVTVVALASGPARGGEPGAGEAEDRAAPEAEDPAPAEPSEAQGEAQAPAATSSEGAGDAAEDAGPRDAAAPVSAAPAVAPPVRLLPRFEAPDAVWYAVNVEDPEVAELPDACRAAYGEDAVLSEADDDPRVLVCSVDAPRAPEIALALAEARDEQLRAPPRTRRAVSAIPAALSERFGCPAGLSPGLVGSRPVCQRRIALRALCPRGRRVGDRCEAAPACRGEDDLAALSGGRYDGCFACPPGAALDLAESVAWQRGDEGAGWGRTLPQVLCRAPRG